MLALLEIKEKIIDLVSLKAFKCASFRQNASLFSKSAKTAQFSVLKSSFCSISSIAFVKYSLAFWC